MGLSLVYMLGLSSSVRIAHIACYLNSSFCTTLKFSVSPSFANQIMPLELMLQGQLSHLNGCKLSHRKLKPHVFCMSGFTLSYTANVVILAILYEFCLLPAQFCYIIVYILRVESRVQIADLCAPCFASAATVTGRCLPSNFLAGKAEVITNLISAFPVGPRYIGSVQRVWKTPLPAVSLLLRFDPLLRKRVYGAVA
jgi:hypothetical protein